MSSGDGRKKKDEKKKNNSILTYPAVKNFMWIFYVSVDLIKKLAPSEFFFFPVHVALLALAPLVKHTMFVILVIPVLCIYLVSSCKLCHIQTDCGQAVYGT